MADIDRDQFGAPATGVVGDTQQRLVPGAHHVLAAGVEKVGKADPARRAVEIGDVALEADSAGLLPAGAHSFARGLELKPNQRRSGWVVTASHTIGPADMDEIARDRCG